MRSLLVALALTPLLGCEPTPAPDAVESSAPVASPAPAVAPVAPSPTPAPIAGSEVLRREAIAHHDPRYRDHFEEAKLLLEEGRSGEAVDALRMALFDTPDSAPTWTLLGETYLQLDRRALAVDALNEAVSHDFMHTPAHRLLARHWLDRGEPDRARRHAEKVRRLLPEDAEGALLLSRVYLGKAMWREAIDESRRAISRDPQLAAAYNNLGFAALQVGQPETARPYLEAATELPDAGSHVWNNLGIAYEKLGRGLDALEAFGRAVRLDPSSPRAIANRDRVRDVVDAQVADEIARMLAARSGDPLSGEVSDDVPEAAADGTSAVEPADEEPDAAESADPDVVFAPAE